MLSFTTTVCVASARGTTVFPSAETGSARATADRLRAELAVSRHEAEAGSPEAAYSLSPASLRRMAHPDRLVLPSPNGAAISAAVASRSTPVVAACLRNAAAVSTYVLGAGYGSRRRPLGVIAAGERWPDGTLRPAIEDLFGAGLVLAALARAGVTLSPEASVAAAAVDGLSPARIADLVRASTSGTELRVAGYGEDVDIAVELDSDTVVPVMGVASRGFRRGRTTSRRRSR